MSVAQWWIFLPACIGMNFFPGPNNLVALVHGIRTNARRATVAGLARLPVMMVMLVLLAVGLEALLARSAVAFQWLRIIGAGYLLWMAWQSLHAVVSTHFDLEVRKSLRLMARSEALVAFTNPKLILIFYAFFPQFIDPVKPVVPQVILMGGTFIVIEIAAIGLYAFGGRWLQERFEDGQSSKWLSRFTAAALTAAAGLILVP
ncbi:MAG: lysine transporter LysE [Gammaproteobacteria bacterium]|nr:lysine transporter LysE [Gammaproteobacteria bacterium]